MQENGAGNYTWIFNSTSVGIFQFEINTSIYGYESNNILITLNVSGRPTELDLEINNSMVSEYTIYYNQSVNIDVNFTDNLNGNPLTGAIIKLNSMNFTEISIGRYRLQYNGTVIGNFTYLLNSSIYGYQPSSTLISINVLQKSTELEIKLNNSVLLEYTLYYNQTLIIEANFTDQLNDDPLIGALLKLNSTDFDDIGGGIYQLQYNATQVGNFSYIINATYNPNYQTVLLIIKINILNRPIKVELYVNGELKDPEGLDLEFGVGDIIEFTVKYKDNLTNRGITGGNVYVNGRLILENSSETGRYDFTYIVNESGSQDLNITIENLGFEINSIIVTIIVPPEGFDPLLLLILILFFVIFGAAIVAGFYIRSTRKPYAKYKKDEVEFILKKYNSALNIRGIIISGKIKPNKKE
jgi:hypothetical protein